MTSKFANINSHRYGNIDNTNLKQLNFHLLVERYNHACFHEKKHRTYKEEIYNPFNYYDMLRKEHHECLHKELHKKIKPVEDIHEPVNEESDSECDSEHQEETNDVHVIKEEKAPIIYESVKRFLKKTSSSKW